MIPLSEDYISVQARVGSLHGDSMVELDFLSSKVCRGCEGGCLWRWKPPPSLRILSSLQVHVNELVTVSVNSQYLMLGTIFLYGLPWLGLLCGAAIGVMSFGNDLSTLLGSFCGFVAGLLLGRYCDTYLHISPIITSKQET
jgi:positive regulator of sigma E activity